MAWLLLAVFCTSFMSVRPVELASGSACASSCHCKVPGDCGMPCGRTAAPAGQLTCTEQSARVSRPVVRQQAATVHQIKTKFFAPFVEPPASLLVITFPAATVPAAAAPLFKAHCSFLL